MVAVRGHRARTKDLPSGFSVLVLLFRPSRLPISDSSLCVFRVFRGRNNRETLTTEHTEDTERGIRYPEALRP